MDRGVPAQPDTFDGLDQDWKASSFCSAATCVEVRQSAPGGHVDISDSKESNDDADRTHITIAVDRYAIFQAELIGQEPAGSNGQIVIDRSAEGWTAFHCTRSGVTLWFNSEEIQAYQRGIEASEFQPQLAAA